MDILERVNQVREQAQQAAVRMACVGPLPQSYTFAADVLEDIVGALREEGHALTDCQKGFFDLAVRTYRSMALVQ